MPDRRFQAVVFDLYGTLVEFSARALDRTLADLADILGVVHADYLAVNADSRTACEAGACETLDAHFAEVYSALNLEPVPERIRAATDRIREFGRVGLVPRADALDTLAGLRQDGYRVGLISNCSDEVPLAWPECPLAPLVDVAVFSCRERLRKPDPRIYHLTCARLGVPPEACLFVGDGGATELTGAAAVGMHAVQLCAPGEDPYDVARLGRQSWCGPRITTLSDVRRLLAT